MKKLLILFILLISVNAWGATYYIRADGTAANKAAATGPCGTVGNCMSVAIHDGETFSAGDIIIVCNDGGVYTIQPTCPSPGSDGSPITYESESGVAAEIWSWDLNEKDYITFDRIWVHGLWLLDGDYTVLKNCRQGGASDTMVFKTTGSAVETFSITTSGGGVYLWAFADGSTDATDDPGTVNFAGDAVRLHSVSFTGTMSSVDENGFATLVMDCKNLPDGLTGSVNLGSASALTGDIGDLPDGLTGSVDLWTASALTGDIGDLPAGLTGNVYLGSASALTYTSANWPMNTGNDKNLRFDAATFSTAEVSDLLCDADTKGNTGCTLNCSSSEAPDAGGVTCKGNLEGDGWTVTVGS